MPNGQIRRVSPKGRKKNGSATIVTILDHNNRSMVRNDSSKTGLVQVVSQKRMGPTITGRMTMSKHGECINS